jgi:NTP pyrophosphatase (non-canonical NTP hydrolase)
MLEFRVYGVASIAIPQNLATTAKSITPFISDHHFILTLPQHSHFQQPEPMTDSEISQLMQRLVAFRDERDWQQFHNPKDLAAALSIEAAELQELFLWKPATDLGLESAEKRERIEEEVADIGAFLLLLCHELNIDLSRAITRKIEKNAQKYPAEKVKGSSKKYNEYNV